MAQEQAKLIVLQNNLLVPAVAKQEFFLSLRRVAASLREIILFLSRFFLLLLRVSASPREIYFLFLTSRRRVVARDNLILLWISKRKSLARHAATTQRKNLTSSLRLSARAFLFSGIN